MQESTLNKKDKLAIGLFLSLTIHQVILNQDKLTTVDADFLLTQICNSIHTLFPTPFEA